MKNFAPIALVALLLTQSLLLGLSAVYPDIKAWQKAEGHNPALKFLSTQQVFTWLKPTPKKVTDQLARLTQKDTLQEKPFDPTRPDADPNGVEGEQPGKIYNPVDSNGHALDNFFLALHHRNKQMMPLRIAHYGDSQIEGDRISVFLRSQFQSRFGGYGFGYVPMTEPANSQNFEVREHTDFVRHSVFQNKVEDGRYHLSGNAWSMPEDATEAYYHFKVSKYAGFGHLKLMWGNAKAPWRLSVCVGDSVLYTDTLPAQDAFTITPIHLPDACKEATLRMYADQSPDFYGLLFDGGGVTVDNYAIRGHAGNGLLKIDPAFMQSQYAHLNTKLVILQYGGNVVPYKDMDEFGWLEQANYNLIRKFQALLPQASVLVVGVGDAAHKDEDGELSSYHTIPLIRAAQKRAAQRAKAAFWDLWAVMGGPGAILAWVEHDPPLAAEDYAHLTWHGQRLIARELFQSLMYEYDRFVGRLEATERRLAPQETDTTKEQPSQTPSQTPRDPKEDASTKPDAPSDV